MHPAEALHGDLGMLARGDALLAISYGGETQEILNLLETLKRLEISIVTLTGNLKSTLAEASDVALDVSVKEEACSLNLAPTASTAVAMARARTESIWLAMPNMFQMALKALALRKYHHERERIAVERMADVREK